MRPSWRTRLREVEGMAELKELRLKVMDLETQVLYPQVLTNSRPKLFQTWQTHVTHNQLKRRSKEVKKLSDSVEESTRKEADLHTLLWESKINFIDLEGKLKEDLMIARIIDT